MAITPDILATPTSSSARHSETTKPEMESKSQAPHSQFSQSVSPSGLPLRSTFPSTKSSLFRLPSQSQNPTALPIPVPSYIPSAIPSSEPSTFPSRQPTSFPSSIPTQSCHDRDDYRSPINGIPCRYHQGTDCTLWRYVLHQNMTALAELIESCPVSCKIPCGSFSLQMIDLSLILSNVSGMLDVMTQTPLEEIGLEYLTEYIASNYLGAITFVLESVTLKFQERLSRRRLRGLQSASQVRLRVVLSLMGFSIGVERRKLIQWLTAAVDSDEFTHSIQKSSVFFEHAQISSTVDEIPRSTAIDGNDGTKSNSVNTTTITVLVAVAAGVVVVVFSIGFLLLHNRLQNHTSSSCRELGMSIHSRFSSASCLSDSSCHSDASSGTPLRGIRFDARKKMRGSLSHSRDSGDDNSIETKQYEQVPDASECSDSVSHKMARVDPVTVVIEGIGEVTKDATVRSPSRIPNEMEMTAIAKGKKEARLLVHVFPSPDEEESVATTPASRTSEAEFGAAVKLKRSASGGDLDFIQSVATKPVSSLATLKLPSNAAPHETNCATHSSSSLAPRSSSGELAWKTPAFLQTGPTQLPRQVPRSLSLYSGKPAQVFHASARRRSGDTPHSKNVAQPLPVRRSRGQGGKTSAHVESPILFHSELRFVLHIPSGGHLGLTIQSGRKQRGSWIYHVWGHSPLLGIVFVGDHIVKVDNTDTSKMDSRTLCELLRHCRCKTTGIIRLVVARQTEEPRLGQRAIET